MTKYGLEYYGTAKYGPDVIVDYDASPFTCTPVMHAAILAQWRVPKGNWTRLRLVRNSYGYPTTESNGTVLLDLNCGPSATGTTVPTPTQFLDTLLTPGRFYYYTLFVYGVGAFNGRDDWRRCGDASGLSVKDYQYTEKMVSLLPTVFTTYPAAVASASDDGTPITRFLSLPGYQLDYLRTQYDTLRFLYDADRVSGSMLPALCAQFGIAYEPEIGMSQLRIIVRNAQHVAKTRGTRLGVEALCTSFSGWGCNTALGNNLLLDYNDSSFEESLGRWVAGASSVIAYRQPGTMAPYAAPDFTNKGAGTMELTRSGSTGTATAILAGVTPVNHGVPVTPGVTYTASAFTRAATTARSVSLTISWYDKAGVFLSSSVGTGTANASGNWTARPFATGVAPAGAVYAGLTASVAACVVGELHYLDAVQFEASATATAFQEARDLRISLHADRVNEIINPNFTVDVANWTATSAAISRVTGGAFIGAASMQVVPSSSAVDSVVSTTAPMPVLPLTAYTASAYVKGGLTTPTTAYVSMTFYDSTGTQINKVSGTSVAAVSSGWTRAVVSAITPSNTASVVFSVQFVAAPATIPCFVDAAILEHGSTVLPYFDANVVGVTHPTDYLWDGTPNASRSHYYSNQVAKTHRLNTLLPKYTWNGSTFTLLLASGVATIAPVVPSGTYQNTYGDTY